MPSQRMIDDAKVFCRDAVGALSRGDWESAAQILLTRCRKLDMALQSLTPGGSEYVGDPERCIAFAKEQIHKGRLARLDLARSQSGASNKEGGKS